MVKTIRKIRNKDGQIVDFKPTEISESIWNATATTGGRDYRFVEELTNIVLAKLHSRLKLGEILGVSS